MAAAAASAVSASGGTEKEDRGGISLSAFPCRNYVSVHFFVVSVVAAVSAPRTCESLVRKSGNAGDEAKANERRKGIGAPTAGREDSRRSERPHSSRERKYRRASAVRGGRNNVSGNKAVSNN